MNDHSEFITQVIAARRRAVAESIYTHWAVTDHTKITEVPDGWACFECGESRFLDPIEVRE